ncbi:hypothetical protein B0H14DRAFT_3518364 [Mycena olivaceomarginata]|nr:hypothetical protein B0H14DRAFT_3518364 [Mycena olivaceomarginata]
MSPRSLPLTTTIPVSSSAWRAPHRRPHAYAGQRRFDGYSRAVKHGVARKAAFDRRVLGSKAGEVLFAPGDLVQVGKQVNLTGSNATRPDPLHPRETVGTALLQTGSKRARERTPEAENPFPDPQPRARPSECLRSRCPLCFGNLEHDDKRTS